MVVKDAVTGTHDVGPRLQGAGRENLSVAANTTVWMDPASASFGKVAIGNPSSLDITLFNPTATDQTFSVSKAKFTPDSFGGTGPAIYNAGTISFGDSRITVPASVTVPANGSTTLTVTVNAGLTGPAIVQGWIKLRGVGNNNLHFGYAAESSHRPNRIAKILPNRDAAKTACLFFLANEHSGNRQIRIISSNLSGSWQLCTHPPEQFT